VTDLDHLRHVANIAACAAHVKAKLTPVLARHIIDADFIQEDVMPPRSLLRAFLALWIFTGVALLVGSVLTVREALAAGHHGNPHLMMLGSAEAVAALLFIVPRSMRVGAAGLLATIGIAFAVHTALGQWRGDLLVYGCVVAFVAVHGTLTRVQWRAAIGV
jgi:hypothetical protein